MTPWPTCAQIFPFPIFNDPLMMNIILALLGLTGEFPETSGSSSFPITCVSA